VNKWERSEREEPNIVRHYVEVPEHVPAPICSRCGEECRELNKAMIGWGRPESFDGFHFFHKGQCDSGEAVYPKSLEISHHMIDTEGLLSFVYLAMRMVEEQAPIDADTRDNITQTVGWLTLLTTQSRGDDDEMPEADDMHEYLDGLRQRQWNDSIGLAADADS
jgi:hypothetical protein